MNLSDVRGRLKGLPLGSHVLPFSRRADLADAASRTFSMRPALWRDRSPIRDALLSPETLEEHARSLARTQAVTPNAPGRYGLTRRVGDNAKALREAYRRLSIAAGAREAVSPAAEWIIDNYHIVERQIRDIRVDLPPGYYRRLPMLASGPFRGYPRILGAAWTYAAHTDSHFSPDVLCRFFRAYQEVQPLTIGELWAVPITLRILLVENLRRFAELSLLARDARALADSVATRILVAAAEGPKDLAKVLSELKGVALPGAFVVHLAQRLRDQDPAVAPALTWLDQRLALEETSIDETVRVEQQREINATVTVRNIITSMRLASDVDWRDLFERMSLVDNVLKTAPGYSSMDFPTRDLYRAGIEQIARGSRHTEVEVAQSAVATAADAHRSPSFAANRASDPGYYLIAEGRRPFERALGHKAPIATWPGRITKALGIGGYVAAGSLVSVALLTLAIASVAAQGVDVRFLWVLAALGALPAIDAAVSIVNHLITRGLKATLLPGVELPDGVADHMRTLLVVPTMLTSPAEIEEQVERLEVHFLSCPKGEIYFALLTDWTDAETEHVKGDDELLTLASRAIDRLNSKYAPDSGAPRFLLLHRRRVWTESEAKWIGWERKRGKLSELNELLAGDATDTTFIGADGRPPPSVPKEVRYVITLDADTRITPDAVKRLIGKMAHPLNSPQLDPETRRVSEGYAILQPRVTPSMPAGQDETPFLRIYSSSTGIDPYAAAASDVYQDLLGEGSYTGKGIYDVAAFRGALAGRAPPSSLLSHDLFEGAFARSGLASDIEFVETFPARYDAAAMRHHRWARGDWQLLPWILGLQRRPRPGGPQTGAPISGRWKMLDNLRRSMSAPAAACALLAGFALPADASLLWTAFVLATMAAAPLIPLIGSLAPRSRGNVFRFHLRMVGSDFRLAVEQWFLATAFLAHQAWLMGDAAIRTIVRLGTRKNLLEWTPAAKALLGNRPTLSSYYRYMAGAVALAAAALLIGPLFGNEVTPLAIAFALLWSASPALAVWASKPPPPRKAHVIAPADAAALRLIARRTWRYFETFVTPTHNFLPPDNFQESPAPIVAHRTSPTNIGLYLLSVVSARELGWIDAIGTAERLEATCATLHKLERFRGHFYNWYDTHDLRPLDPRYISSVDSGNLAGHLIALAQACRTWSVGAHTLGAPCFDADALAIAREEARALRGKRGAPLIQWPQIEQQIESLERTLRALPCDGDDVRERLKDLAVRTDALIDALEAHALNDGDDSAELRFWLAAAARSLSNHATQLDPAATAILGARLETLADDFRELALSMDFSFLLDRERLLLSIGYRGSDGVLDPSCYDLLASEARLASLLAIAKGDAPNKHWFRLSHAVVPLARGLALISWSGSMFEYLMPSLVMQEPTHSVLERTNRLIVNRQIEYGRKLKTPWGVSESAYNARDLDFTYQYSNFGVPGLGLKRGLADNIVVSPYATALAAMVAPTAAVRNFERLAQLGARGRYGFYEAIDFTPERLQSGERAAIVQCFMAHHQGMTITALANVICNGLLRRHFHAEPIIQASELLLQERMPRDVQAPPAFATVHRQATESDQIEPAQQRRTANPWSASPATHLLSNGRYTVMLTAAGSGYSAWRNLAITRWREDSTRDDWGSYFYVRDAKTGECLSPTLQPTCHRLHDHRATFDEEKAVFTCEANGLAATMDVIVSEEDDAEVRRVSVKNSGREARDLEITSFAELALAPPAADLAHPAFSKLFIEVEHLPRAGALLARRRRRAPDEPEVWAAHLAVVEGTAVGLREFETSRARFVGRSRDVHEPIAALSGSPLAGTVGATLDPIFSLRRRVRVEPGETARIHYWTIAAGSRREALDLIDKHNDVAAYERAATLAWTQSQVELHHIGIDRDTAALYQRLAGHLIYATPAMRPSSDTIRGGRGEQSLLWSLGVSGDLPILLVRVSETQELRLVEEALQAFEYFRAKRLPLDLVFLNERDASYQQDLQDALESAVRASQARPHIGAEPPAGNIYVLRADLITPEARGLLSSVARVILHGERGRLGDQLRRRPETEHFGLRARRNTSVSALQPPGLAPNLDYFNGLGGFAKDGKEYVITLAPGQNTPAPWINVVANAAFGFQTSESGAGFTWSESSREHQITPWSNDPVSDSPGQAFFIRDRDTGELWSPTAAPVRSAEATYVARHGRGYSRYECDAPDLALALTEYVPLSDPIKISRLTITNTSSLARRLSVTAYVEWVLGPSRSSTAPLVTTELCASTGAILAANCWNPAFKHRVAFADFRGRQASWTGDRREFIGRNGSLSNPAALAHDAPLSGRLGAGLDPCAALQTSLDLGPGGSAELVFLLGDAASDQEATALIGRYRDNSLDDVLSDVRAFWDDLLGAVQVKTPDRSLDIMVNGWLLYQTLACRIWARSGFYQASGAYGFRDQLQDAMALSAQRPQITRDQILRAAARQFLEGDVQHWWLPQTGQGVRTRISDDRVWLAFAVAHYLRVTGDSAVLDEQIPFLDGPLLDDEEPEAFFRPQPGNAIGSLYEHCARALDASLAVGSHGAPLIGGGDWNDGMNRVGAAGRGESVWLGWFLHTTLSDFAPIADRHGDAPRAAIWRAHAKALSVSLHREAWDGDWYRRGWYDDGAPLGSASSEECRIDSIAQSWAVLSGAADEERARRAMAAVERDLIRPQDGLALLFAPPFDRTSRDPGYIKGYPPGVRENGGQYTHGAVWSVMAFAALGDGDKASALFWMLNPINHARTRADVHRYKVEPYVMAADVYSAQNLVGRGGWTWYTGSAGLMHRAALEHILGLRVEGAHFRVDPCIPRSWPEFQLSLRFGLTRYDVFVVNPDGVSSGVASAALDGTRLTGPPFLIPIIRDGKGHRVDIVLGQA